MTGISFVNSTGGGALNGANVTLTYPAGVGVGDVSVVTVTLGTSKASTLSVTSSSGAASFYSQIVSTIQSSNVRFGVFRRVIASSAELSCIVTGTGGSTDSTTAVLQAFDFVERTTPEDVTATSTNGSGTTPDSPSITVASCGCAIISAVGIGIVSAPTAPSSFLNSVVATGNDTNKATSAMAWITNASTAAFNPTTWTSTSATWISATVALRRGFGHDQGGIDVCDSNENVVRESRKTVVRSY